MISQSKTVPLIKLKLKIYHCKFPSPGWLVSLKPFLSITYCTVSSSPLQWLVLTISLSLFRFFWEGGSGDIVFLIYVVGLMVPFALYSSYKISSSSSPSCSLISSYCLSLDCQPLLVAFIIFISSIRLLCNSISLFKSKEAFGIENTGLLGSSSF